MSTHAARLRALAATLVAGVLLAASTSHVAAADAPPAPSGLIVHGQACGSSGAGYVNDRTPFVSATTPRIATGEPLQVLTFQVVRVSSGEVVWSERTDPDHGGWRVSVEVPSKLAQGVALELRVSAKNVGGGASAVVTCRFGVDDIAPGPMRIVRLSSADTPVDAPAQFRLVGDEDTVAFRFGENQLPDGGGEVPATDGQAVVTFTPTRPGSTTLLAEAIDRAGNAGPETAMTHRVPYATATHAWLFDEGAGRAAADSYGDQALTVTSSTQWVAERQDDGTMLRFDGEADAVTGPAVVDTATSFGLAATLVPATRDARIAVSQAASEVTAFALGVVRDTRCPTGDGVCFALSLRASDRAGAARTRVMSGVPVVPGHRYRVVATSNASARTGTIWVFDKEVDPWEGDAVTTTVSSVAPSTGVFRVGSAKLGGVVIAPWRGRVDDVVTLAGAVDRQLAGVLASINR